MSEATVFIVDDDEDLRSSLQDLIEAEGLAARSFASARQFLQAVGETRAGCLIVDIHMPGMDGLELQRKLRREQVSIPVIVITGCGDVPKAVNALKAGAIDFIEKPFSGELVLNSVREALEISKRVQEKEALTAHAAHHVERLTPREREVFNHLVLGDSNKMIASKLSISPRTVEVHRARIMEKMQAQNLSHLVQMALALEARETA